jgi:transposase
VIPLTVPEVHRLLQPGTSDAQQRRLAWSRWRRRHQAIAQRCHTARRAQHQPDACSGEAKRVHVPGTAPLTEQGWAPIVALRPPQKPARGRSANDHRCTLEGMLWVMHMGAAWREVPAHVGPWHTLHSGYQRWCQAGIWAQSIDWLHATTSETPTWNSGYVSL